jgi:hypothetical protein
VRVHQLQADADRRRGDDLLELAEHALRRHPLQPRRGAPDRRGRLRLDREIEVDREPHGAQRAQGVVLERLRADHPQTAGVEVGTAAVRVQQLPAAQRLGHRVDGEVACGEVGVDVPLAQHDEVDVPAVPRADDAPGAERAGEPEGGAAGRARERASGILRIDGERDVEVGGAAAEQPVTHGAADDPRLLPGEHLTDRLDGDPVRHARAARAS